MGSKVNSCNGFAVRSLADPAQVRGVRKWELGYQFRFVDFLGAAPARRHRGLDW
jgi:hypothetical protein